MKERYDSAAAAHYAAYRPPLHERLLSRELAGLPRFATGLDLGCGTGASAIALATYCERVVGIDPSPEMLARARPSERVSYREGSAEAIPLPDQSVELVTLAGVVPYVDREAAAREICRVARPGARVVVYDFEVLLDDVLRQLGAPAPAATGYDHRADLSGAEGLGEEHVDDERVRLELAPDELAHVLLSDSHRLDALSQRLDTTDPFNALSRQLDDLYGTSASIDAHLYMAIYDAEIV